MSGLALAAAPATTSLHRGAFLGALAAGLFSGWVAGSLAPLVPKGPYVAYGLAAAVSAGLLVLILRRPASSVARGALVAMVAATAMLAASVSGYWGGDGAVLAARVGAGLAMAPLFAGRLKSPSLYRNDVPTLAFGGLVIGLLGVVVIFGHSYFVDERMATVTRDSEGRIRHWSDSLALLSSDLDWAMGIGPGRFAVDYFWKIPARLKPGDFRIVSGGAGKALRLSGPSAPVGWGEIFRVSQQVDPALQLPVAVQVRAAVPAGEGARSVALHLEICRKMLLYNGACAVRNIELTPGERDYVTVLDAKGLGPRSVLGIPVPTAFALGLDSTGGLADILSIQATDGRGHALLRNGEFSENGAWWFFSSDRFHLPYHAKNLWLQFLVEQGIPGVTAITLLGGFAILWLAVGPGRGHPAAAPWLAGLIGFGIVGLTDTIVDAPRLATLMYLMCGGALSLRAPPPRAA
ncbi:MAG: hypothetical protein GC151_07080 [Betaproteobacteria bacterium]|nr:hypothetical protein [Betaproteobacteria bacterium]